ncbi:MAG: pilus assembly protein PilP [Betaproteobacteria bacterium]|nr:pilus assembly protein PilP [Betaproteobacteria bacterium]
MKRAWIVLLALGCAACSGGEHQDLQQFVRQANQGLRGHVTPLPQVTPYVPYTYNDYAAPSPFDLARLIPAPGAGGVRPNLDRPKGPLEAYSLQTLHMVGILERKGDITALVEAPDGKVFSVRVGDHMGQNFGTVTRLTPTEIDLKEIVQDDTGQWTQRENKLLLEQNQEQKK